MQGTLPPEEVYADFSRHPEVMRDPYPHFVLDGGFSEQLRSDIHRNWPGKGYFAGEMPGNYICNLANIRSDFWGLFRGQILPRIISEVMGAFAPYIMARFPQETIYEAYVSSLMQSRGDYGGHDVHNHHYHDPTFVATILVYLDTISGGHQGTTLLRTKEGVDEVAAAAQTLRWHDLTEEEKTIAYHPGRIFAFYDNPLAYHAVNPSGPGATFGRRILRVHMRALESNCERLYGVDYKTYQQKRLFPSEDPQVLGWMRKDIDEMRSTPRITQEERIAWLRTLRIAIGQPPREDHEPALA